MGSADLLLNTDILTPSVVSIHTNSSTAFSPELPVLSLVIKMNPPKLTDLSISISYNYVSVKHINQTINWYLYLYLLDKVQFQYPTSTEVVR